MKPEIFRKAASMLVGVTISVAMVSVSVSEPSAQSTGGVGQSADPARGKTLYQGCTACHSIDENDIGPKHRGVVGRRAGTVEDYAYSPALKTSGLTWDARTLDRWLSNPSELVPGTKMYFKLDSPQDRADVIAYLMQLK